MIASPALHPPSALPQLHGREAELAAVRRALADPTARTIAATGGPGAGKTGLMRAVLDEARAGGGLTGAGKYPQGLAVRDLEPLVGAIEDALEAGLDQLFDAEAGVRDLRRALGDNAAVLSAVGSGPLRGLAEPRDTAPVTAERADERLAQAILQVLRWLEGFGAPVLLLVDDWGRAGPQARRLFARLAAEPSLALTRLLATERDDEPNEEAPPGTLRVAVGALPPAARLSLCAEQLGPAAAEAAEEVVGFLGAAAETPFELIESVRLLSGVALRRTDGRWRLQPRLAISALAGAAASSVVRRVAGLDPGALTLARMLAVAGDDAELADLAYAARQDPGDARAAAAVLADAGLVRPVGSRIRYAHDRLRAEVLLDVPVRARVAMAAALAEALRETGARPGEGARGMAMLWRRLEGGLEAADPVYWRDAFATGAAAARQVGDRETAAAFVRAGLELSGRAGGFSYALLAEAVQAAISRGDHAEACRLSDAMSRHAATPAERAAADEFRVFARRVSGDLDAALQVAREVLARVGVRLPERVTAANLLRAIVRVFALDPRKAGTPLGPEALAVEAPMMRAMNGIGSLLFERDPLLAVVLVTRFLSDRVVYGTAAGAGSFALLSCSFGSYGRAAAWADAADRLQGPDQPLRAVAKQYSASFGHVFARPRSLTRTRGEEMEALAWAGGDLAVAVYGNRDRVLDALFSDQPLAETVGLADEAVRVAERLSDTPTLPHVRALRQLIAGLQAGGEAPWRLDGAHLRLDAALAELEAADLANTGRAVAALEAMLGACFGAYDEVAALTRRSWPRFAPAPFQAQSQIWAFATGLALYRTGGRPGGLQRWNLRRLARRNPADFRHRARLLDAEALRVSGRRGAALRAYAEAVAAARLSRCWLEQGLVAVAASEAAAQLDSPADAAAWREEGRSAWQALGADALVRRRFGERGDPLTGGRPPAPPQPSRAEALRAQLGDAAEELLGALRPSVEAELAALAAAVAAGDAAEADVRLHRLRGLAEHFGLEALRVATGTAAPPAAQLAAVRAAVRDTDWRPFGGG
jgi:hypothetical protein